MHILEPRICSFKLDVQETDMCVTQFDTIRKYFSRCKSPQGRNSRAWQPKRKSKNRNSSKGQRNLWLKGTHSVTPSCLANILNYQLLICSSNVNSPHKGAMLYISEDDEAVIRMIFRGRSPTRRHVFQDPKSRYWSVVSQNFLDPKIRITYVNSKNQTRRHVDQGTFHWMEPSSVLVQY